VLTGKGNSAKAQVLP